MSTHRDGQPGGWFLLNDQEISVTWSGGDAMEDLVVTTPDGSPARSACSHFGFGILTWHIPYLFRTPPGFNLLVRGPANSPKDGISPMEGLVETDWSEATFTMNWKLTRPGHAVRFEMGEPFAMVVPQRRGELESFQPEIRDLVSVPALHDGYLLWARQRDDFNAELRRPDSEAVRRGWQKHYFQGVSPSRGVAVEHQTKLSLRAFVEAEPAAGPAAENGRRRENGDAAAER